MALFNVMHECREKNWVSGGALNIKTSILGQIIGLFYKDLKTHTQRRPLEKASDDLSR